MKSGNGVFDARALLTTPRFGPAVPNPTGTLVLHTTSTYSFESHSSSNEICLLDVESGKRTVVTHDDGASEPSWLGVGDLFVYLKTQAESTTSLVVCDAHDLSESYEAGHFDGPVSGLKFNVLDNTTIAFVVSGQAAISGELHDPSREVARCSTGRLYTSLPVRHWDSYVTEIRNTIFYGILKKSDRRFTLEPKSLRNVLKSLPGLESPLPPFGDSSQYDIGRSGVVFISKAPTSKSATLPASSVYLISIQGTATEPSQPQELIAPGLNGASSAPVFSPDGLSLAYLKMKEADYESDKNRIILIPDISSPDKVQELFASEDGRGSWDSSPSSITWSRDGKLLLVTAQQRGRVKLFGISVDSRDPPAELTKEGCISSVVASGEGETKLFLTSSTFTESSRYTILDPRLASPPKILLSSSPAAITPSQISEIWYPGRNEQEIHAFIVTPANFDPLKKYPLAFLIHGGPQYAWQDDFPVEGVYNPFVFAAAGYVVFLPNITGSLGYGQAFTDSIRSQWGGKPYRDLEDGLSFIQKNLKYADTERAVALGGSWGGYMINWLAGQPLGARFKALVSDSGIFCTKTFASATDEGWFPKYEFEGHWWAEGQTAVEKWDPSTFIGNWTTPMLIVHNEKDMRHPVSDGVAAFSALQERGIASAFLTFEDEGHMAVQPENVLVLYREILDFFGGFVTI